MGLRERIKNNYAIHPVTGSQAERFGTIRFMAESMSFELLDVVPNPAS